MTIKDIPNVKYIAPTHRCYEYMLDFVVAVTSFANYFKAYHDKPVRSLAPKKIGLEFVHEEILLEGSASKKSVGFVPHELLVDVIQNNTRDSKIAYLEKPFEKITGVSMDGASIIEGFSTSMFVRYYEDNKDKIENKYSADSDKWPEVLRFSRVVRNSMSHGGKIRIDNPCSRPVSHFGLTYSASDNGRKILHVDLSPADIFYLMLDMDLAF